MSIEQMFKNLHDLAESTSVTPPKAKPAAKK